MHAKVLMGKMHRNLQLILNDAKKPRWINGWIGGWVAKHYRTDGGFAVFTVKFSPLFCTLEYFYNERFEKEGMADTKNKFRKSSKA